MDLEHGNILEGSKCKWFIQDFLSRGTCCCVFEAIEVERRGDGGEESKYRKTDAAVKVYKEGMQYESAGMNEVDILQRIHSDETGSNLGRLFIVNLVDHFYHDGHLCLVNNLLWNNLHNILLKNGGEGLPLYIIQKCCRDLAHGLSYLSQEGIVHGDIKPTNIMWNAREEVFQLVDFGLSFLEAKQPPQPLQSPGYQAPEALSWNKRLKNHKTKDMKVPLCHCASDMWSFACVLFYLYTGKQLLFHSKGEKQFLLLCDSCKQDKICPLLMEQHLSQQPLESKTITMEQHKSMMDLLSKMLKCRPEARIKPIVVLDHPFLDVQHSVSYPSLSDLLLLPTRVLQLANMFDDVSELCCSEEYEDFVTDVREECARYGVVTSIRVPSVNSGTSSYIGKVFVEFEYPDDCEVAQSRLAGRTFNRRTVITSYFPSKHYKGNVFY